MAAHNTSAVKVPINRFAEPFALLGLNINFHLIIGVIKIATRIPHGGVGLHPPLAISGAREDCIVTTFRSLPVERPETPGILCLILSEFRGVPTRPAIG